MTSGTLLGIDIGTTGVRATVFGSDGTPIADASQPCAHDAPHPGWAEADPDAWWRALGKALRDLRERVPCESQGLRDVAAKTSLTDVACIAVCGQAPTAVLVDESGGVVRPAILWLDTRAETEARELGVQAYYLGPKLKWLERHEPEALARTRWVLQSHAFVAYRLTGAVAIDASTAALCLPLFDLAKLAWVHDAFMPPLRPSHEVLGVVTPEAATATGLRAGTPVVVGGGDFAAATLGAGVLEEGEACLMLGTAGNLLVPRKTPGTDARLINAHHVGTESWLSLGGTLSGGAQEWFRHALARGSLLGEDDDTGVRGALPTFEVLDGEAVRVPAGSDGLLFLPYLQGERTPIWDVAARGAYVGLELRHGRGHLWRALLEGIALGFVDCQAVLEDGGVVLREVIAANGGGKSALFRQILCDALGVPLAYAAKGGGTALGAAMLAGLGAGVLTKVADARSWRGELVRHEPDRVAHARYRELLGLRREAYGGLKGVFHGLARLREKSESARNWRWWRPTGAPCPPTVPFQR